jgi:predicted O-methyltransferase YrrM
MYYLKKALKHWIKICLGICPYPKRYEQLYQEIDVLHPRTIFEIGTNDGINAARLYQRASQYRNDVEYFGFDLFESIDNATFMKEFSLAAPTKKEVDRFLGRKGVRNRHLFSGNTMESLPGEKERLPAMDLVFIDGGHSEETVASDWENVKHLLHEKSVVFFDDYPNWGVGPVVDGIDSELWDIEVMEIEDEFLADGQFGSEVKGERMKFKFARVKPL